MLRARFTRSDVGMPAVAGATAVASSRIRRQTLASAVALVTVSLLAASPAPALAADTTGPEAPALVPFTITDHNNFASDVNPFTATGPLCPSGTFVADTRVFAGHPDASGQINLLNRIVYTCDDGSGTFTALEHVFITVGPDGSFTSTGPIQLLGGTGAFGDLTGHGVENGTSIDGGTGVLGQISGFVVEG
jgi:hypothetical protein